MNDTKMLLGSLSNDLYRCACLIQRGSLNGASKFLDESERWTHELQTSTVKKYIRNIVEDLRKNKNKDLDMAMAEKYLMYSVVLQNYALHFPE